MKPPLTATDIIAFILITGYIFLAWRGVATMLSSAVLLIVGFYFGSNHQRNRPPDTTT